MTGNRNTKKRVVVGMSGASGAILGIEALRQDIRDFKAAKGVSRCRGPRAPNGSLRGRT